MEMATMATMATIHHKNRGFSHVNVHVWWIQQQIPDWFNQGFPQKIPIGWWFSWLIQANPMVNPMVNPNLVCWANPMVIPRVSQVITIFQANWIFSAGGLMLDRGYLAEVGPRLRRMIRMEWRRGWVVRYGMHGFDGKYFKIIGL